MGPGPQSEWRCRLWLSIRIVWLKANSTGNKRNPSDKSTVHEKPSLLSAISMLCSVSIFVSVLTRKEIMKKCCYRLRLRTGVAVDENLPTPTPTRTPTPQPWFTDDVFTRVTAKVGVTSRQNKPWCRQSPDRPEPSDAASSNKSTLRGYRTSKTPYVAIDELGLVRSIHLFLFSCVH